MPGVKRTSLYNERQNFVDILYICINLAFGTCGTNQICHIAFDILREKKHSLTSVNLLSGIFVFVSEPYKYRSNCTQNSN